MLKLNSLPTQSGKHKRRLGRGNGSGRGSYAGRGIKGQKARTGSRKGLQLKGLKATFKSIPKSKGFTSITKKIPALNVGELQERFTTTAVVHAENYKILGQGDLKKAYTVFAKGFSVLAKQKIEQAGGKVVPCGK
ncbi:MAG: mitochondrial large ribosomal subunit protein uL15m [Candidatus Kerfeldbacteria bacterium]|nr:mitochondrial large ribosomal subunit protein uL15m [Candidatus Kerfeldbacteria bacterium]